MIEFNQRVKLINNLGVQLWGTVVIINGDVITVQSDRHYKFPRSDFEDHGDHLVVHWTIEDPK
jgi:hypothetical protein